MAAMPAIKHEKLVEQWVEALFDRGWIILRDVVDPAVMQRLDGDLREGFEATPFSEGHFYGDRTQRFGRGLSRSPVAAELVQHELVLPIARRALAPWCDSIQLNLTQAIAVHPGAPAQLPHRDQDMWPGPKGRMEYTLNVIWPLTRFTRETGATKVWSYSNHAADDDLVSDELMVDAAMEPGSALLFLGSTLHGQGCNSSDEIRRAFVVGYSLSWLKQFENQYLSYPPAVAKQFPRELAELVGYGAIPSNLNSYDGRSPMLLLEDEVPAYPGAVDIFRPNQCDAIHHYRDTGQART